MNKIILAAIFLFFAGCTNSTNSSHEHKEISGEKPASAGDHLQLNNGKKWRLDETTRENIAAVKSLMAGSLESQATLATNLQRQTDKLVSECKMEGPDHAALHIWLEQWLEHLRDFKNGGAASEAALRSLQKDVTEFDNYFE
jgi:hypothetical protein